MSSRFRGATVTLALLSGAARALAQTQASVATPRVEDGKRLGDEKRHRVGVATSLGPSLMFTALGADGRYQEKYAFGFSMRLDYGYQVVRGFELGATASVWYLPRESVSSSYNMLMPAIALRPYLPLGLADAVELGLSVRPGAAIIHITPSRGTWTGFGISGGPDARVWLGPNCALQLGLEISIGTGHNSEATGFQNESGGFGALGSWAMFVARF